MRQSLQLYKIVLALLLSLPLLASAAVGQVPASRAVTFAGQSIAFPEVLAGKPAILVVSFSKKGGESARQWNERLARKYGSNPSLAYYNLPVLADVPSLLRRMVTSAIKKSVPERDYPHFAPIFEHEAEWKSAAGYATKDDAYVLLVSRDGRIVWRAHGSYSDALLQELSAKLQQN